MKRADDVFFFTLIDFLIQVFFFGLLLFVVSKAIDEKEKVKRGLEAKQVDELISATGVSNLTELQDYLTRLAPVKSLIGTSAFITRLGGQEKATAFIDLVDRAGGIDQVKAKLQKYDEAYGQPPCLKNEVRGKVSPRVLATLRVEDEFIEFQRSTPELEQVLKDMGTSFEAVHRLSLDDFKAQFQPIKSLYPTCAHFVDVQVQTQFLKPMRAVWANFRVR